MSGQGGLVVALNEEVALLPAGQTPRPQTAESTKPEDSGSEDERRESEGEEEEEVKSFAHLEASTLPWSGDKDKKVLSDEDDDASGSERDTGISRGSQDMSEEQSQAEGEGRSKSKWRESMPEVERWRDNIQVEKKDKGGGSLADDEEEEEEQWTSEKPSLGFTPHVEILKPSSKDLPEEAGYFREEVQREVLMEHDSAAQYYHELEEEDNKYYLCENFCSEKLRLVLAAVAAVLLFPLLVWGGYALLPFEPPQLETPPLRVLYTLRCAFFASVPVVLGVLVQGVARLRFSAVKPLYQGELVNKEVMIHWHFVNESAVLFLFYFLQLAVMATYVSQELVKLVPLLTIIFVFGRLIYWVCLALDSTVRGFGFGLSFFPIVVMLGANLYYVCSSDGQGSVFDLAPPATDPPPRMRWWF